MEILLGIIVILLVISNVYLMIAMQRQNRKPEINPQIEETGGKSPDCSGCLPG